MATFLSKIGEQIRKERRLKGMSQEQLAEASKIDPKSIIQIEAGKRNPTIKTLKRVASALHLPLSEITK